MKPLAEVTEADIQALVDARVSESQTLDFKRDLPGADNKARHELCADVSAFANTAGGDLIFGIDEDDEGRAQVIVPAAINPDAEQLRLQDMILNGVEPRIPGLQIKAIDVAPRFAKGRDPSGLPMWELRYRTKDNRLTR